MKAYPLRQRPLAGFYPASQVPKRKAYRKQNLPAGEARYDPTSPEWMSILEEQENKKKTKVPKKVVKTSQPAKLTKPKSNQNKTLKSVPPKKPADKKADQSGKRKLSEKRAFVLSIVIMFLN